MDKNKKVFLLGLDGYGSAAKKLFDRGYGD